MNAGCVNIYRRLKMVVSVITQDKIPFSKIANDSTSLFIT